MSVIGMAGGGAAGTPPIYSIDFLDIQPWADSTVPDGWSKISTHNANNYVEEDALGLRYISDGTNTGIKISDIMTISVNYKITINVAQSNDPAILIVFDGTTNVLSATGDTIFTAIASTGHLTIKRQSGALDMVIRSVLIEEA